MAQLLKRPTLGSGSGHDLEVREIEPRIRLCADGAEPAWDSLHPSFACAVSLSLSKQIIVSKTMTLVNFQ